VAAILTGAALVVYGRALHGPFLYDDFSLPFLLARFPERGISAGIAAPQGLHDVCLPPLELHVVWASEDVCPADALEFVAGL
jgi:hypothetical protein